MGILPKEIRGIEAKAPHRPAKKEALPARGGQG
jgi:hypothetical protein